PKMLVRQERAPSGRVGLPEPRQDAHARRPRLPPPKEAEPLVASVGRERARRGLQAHGGGVTDPELVARAEHELRGAATALALACEALRRDPAASGHATVIEAQLDRLRAGLEDLGSARGEAGEGAETASM